MLHVDALAFPPVSCCGWSSIRWYSCCCDYSTSWSSFLIFHLARGTALFVCCHVCKCKTFTYFYSKSTKHLLVMLPGLRALIGYYGPTDRGGSDSNGSRKIVVLTPHTSGVFTQIIGCDQAVGWATCSNKTLLFCFSLISTQLLFFSSTVQGSWMFKSLTFPF